MIVTASVILIVCALICLVAHVLKPNVPIWPTVLFVLIIQLLQVVPIK